MINEVVVFWGSNRDFDKLLEERLLDNEDTIPFMELIQHYNARLRPNESGVKESSLRKNIEVENCICRSDDYGSVLEHVLSNFVNIVSLNHNINRLFVQNPPKKVLKSLKSTFGKEIEYKYSEHKKITVNLLKKIYKNLNKGIFGQDKCKKQLISGIYRLTKNNSYKPVVFLLYGPSGVGKTESARIISNSLGGKLLRVQFSMMQTSEAYNYVFGSEHSRGSFARDMISRESNVILIDEFDKVHPNFYNAFYQVFDEGRYVDANYDVDLKKTIFLCTCNFNSEEEIKQALGPAMFSRIGCCIKYSELISIQKKTIVEKWYENILNELNYDEKKIIMDTNILNWFLDNVERFDNIRILKTKIEQAIFDKLTDEYIIKPNK
ncbi:AAA family ATPase [Clostridium perfringens]